MMRLFSISFLLFGVMLISCGDSISEEKQTGQYIKDEGVASRNTELKTTIYQSENLVIEKLSEHIYQHISFLITDDFGKVSCNGMVVINENKAVIFDSPTDNRSARELIEFISLNLKTRIIAIIPTHFHNDCIGGIKEFEEDDIPVYASVRTIEQFNTNKIKFSKQITEFNERLVLQVGDKNIFAEYFGEGHTKDNIIGYFPEEHTLFGGCLIKEIGASKGFLGDANTEAWSETVRKILLKYPNPEIVIPGHGKPGGSELLNYTIQLFELE